MPKNKQKKPPFKFSQRSLTKLGQCVPELQEVMIEAIKYINFSVVCGHRGQAEQDKAYLNGYSTLKYPKSNHNTYPSEAVDVIPYPSGYKHEEKFYELAGVIRTIAQQKNIELRWGGTWKNFPDLPHWEVV